MKVPTLINGNDDAVKKRFSELFADAQTGQRRIVTFGLYAFAVKFVQLKHGQFVDWVKGNFGESAYRSIRSHMQLTKSALQEAGIKKLKPVFQNGSTLPISNNVTFLLEPENKVPAPLKPLREKLANIVDGKSARALFTEFKQLEEVDDEDGEKKVKPKRGRRPGEGGATAAQRAAAALREEEERKTAIKLEAGDYTKWCDKNANDKGVGCFRGSDEWKKLKEAASALVTYMNRADDRAAKGGQQ